MYAPHRLVLVSALAAICFYLYGYPLVSYVFHRLGFYITLERFHGVFYWYNRRILNELTI